MEQPVFQVIVKPFDISVHVPAGTLLGDAIAQAGIGLRTVCNGKGTCGKCAVQVLDGAADPQPTEKKWFDDGKLTEGFRLACQSRVAGDCVVDVPADSIEEQAHQILTHSLPGTCKALSPAVRKQVVSLDPPSREDPRSDTERLTAALEETSLPLALQRKITPFFRDNAWKGTAVTADGTLIDIEPGETTGALYGVAVDIGTTTIAVRLIECTSGETRGALSCVNPQTAKGSDIISRINACMEHPEAAAKMRSLCADAVGGLIRELCAEHTIEPEQLYAVTIVGNTAMQQLFLGLDSRALGAMPFVAVFNEHVHCSGAETGLPVNPRARCTVAGQIGGFVGGDILADMVVCGIDNHKNPVLLIDIGTNGEIVCAANDTILATSTAAGPALEGAKISCGMRAARGAIDTVTIDGDVHIHVIGDEPPRGICGSGLIDVAAQMLSAGIMDISGRIVTSGSAPAALSAGLTGRLVETKQGTDFVLVRENEHGKNREIRIKQSDINEIQLAKGAISAGISILLQQNGITVDDIEKCYIAGAFGFFISIENAMRIGLLPRMEKDKVVVMGNGALEGASAMLLSTDTAVYAENLRKMTRHVDLSMDPQFQMEFGMAMLFPCAD